MDKGQRNELGKAACLLLERAQLHQMFGPVFISFDMAKHDRCSGLETNAVRRTHHGQPFLGVHLIWTDDGADIIR